MYGKVNILMKAHVKLYFISVLDQQRMQLHCGTWNDMLIKWSVRWLADGCFNSHCLIETQRRLTLVYYFLILFHCSINLACSVLQCWVITWKSYKKTDLEEHNPSPHCLQLLWTYRDSKVYCHMYSVQIQSTMKFIFECLLADYTRRHVEQQCKKQST